MPPPHPSIHVRPQLKTTHEGLQAKYDSMAIQLQTAMAEKVS